jgi:hypothetical protein
VVVSLIILVVSVISCKRKNLVTFTTPQDFFDCFEKLVELGEIRRFAFYGSINNDEEAYYVDPSRTKSGHYRLCCLVAEALKEGGLK